jgi:hypothetical protein
VRAQREKPRQAPGRKPSFALYLGYALNLFFLLSFIVGLVVGMAFGRFTAVA